MTLLSLVFTFLAYVGIYGQSGNKELAIAITVLVFLISFPLGCIIDTVSGAGKRRRDESRRSDAVKIRVLKTESERTRRTIRSAAKKIQPNTVYDNRKVEYHVHESAKE